MKPLTRGDLGTRPRGQRKSEGGSMGTKKSAEDIVVATQRNGGLEDARLNFDTRSAPVVDEGLNQS